jgi:hypothetical protein
MTIFNVARNNNKILDLGGLSADALGGGTNDTRVFIGQPVGTNYLVRWSHVDPADGRPVYLDAQGNQTKEWSTNNRVAAGKVLPDAVGGLANNFTLGKWFLDVLFTYSIGGNLYDGSAKRQFGVVGQWAMRPEIADRWREPGDIATYPRLTTKASTYGLDTEWNYNTTLFLYDATFARLRNLTLGYNFPTTPKSKIKNMRLFVVGTNLLTFTKYPGLDPEIARDFDNVQDRNFSVGVTYLTAPQQKSVSLGLNLGF